MRFRLDPTSPTPPSEQLADQVRFAVAAGGLRVGDRLPSVRTLAVEVRVNPNTILRAWRELDREGVVESRRGEGVFVARGALAVCRDLCDRLVGEHLGRAVAEARATGLGGGEILDLVRGALEAWGEVHRGLGEADRQRDEEEETDEVQR